MITPNEEIDNVDDDHGDRFFRELHVLPGREPFTIPEDIREAAALIERFCHTNMIDDLSLGRVNFS
ncbi:MAG: hypothetical protein P1U85_19110 [Verrucomicrobiales bacterium]|jgi:hypothetical protein|nr:hypothetical protein [Verrucomicrobiales bacterium]